MWNRSLYGNYRARKFTQIWGSIEDFMADYSDIDDNLKLMSNDGVKTLFYLLYARYGNSTIASSDENQFKYKVFSTMYMYGPTWEKRMEIQKAVRELDLDEIMDGGKAIYNSALNPGGAPAMDSWKELEYINSQNTTKYKKSKVDAYAILTDLLKTDVTEAFIGQFKKLFLTVVQPEVPLWYITELQGDEDDA